MPEILTESFCERCGTRYTFESTAPRGKRIGRFKTLSKGLKTFVMSDDTSLDEALASARSEEEREATAQQLDAFHKTFNFCMTCRQYTCANCWNEPEGRCLTCAPNLGREVLGAPFPQLETNGVHGHPEVLDEAHRIEAAAWPVADLRPGGADSEAPAAAAAAPAWPEVDGEAGADQTTDTDGEPEPDVASRLARISADAWPDVPVRPVDVAVDVEASPAVASAEPDAVLEPEVVEAEPVAAVAEPEVVDVEPVAAVAEPERRIEAPALPVDERAAAAAAQTKALLARFRPGQSIDEALEAYEAAHASTPEPEPEPVVAEPEPEPEPVVAEPEPEPVVAEPEPVVAEPEPVVAEPEPEPVVAEPEPVAAAPVSEPPARPRPADDRVEVPTWRIVAPDTTPANGHPTEPAAPIAASADPQWPAAPQWPNAPAPEPDSAAAFLAARAATPGNDALWAASSRDVVAPPGSAVPAGVQSCVSCGLSLSATARFCRRCGSPQQH